MLPKRPMAASDRRRPWVPCFAVLAALACLGPLHASAQEADRPVDPDAKEAISKIRSPFCPGLMLEICPTAQAQALRDSIAAMADTGIEADSLVDLIVARYGEEYRAYPQRTGAGLLAWLAPPAALLLGLGLVVVALRHMREPEDPAADVGLSEDERRLLDEALAHMEEDEA